MSFHNFIEVNMICELFNSINDTGKTKAKYKKKFLPPIVVTLPTLLTLKHFFHIYHILG